MSERDVSGAQREHFIIGGGDHAGGLEIAAVGPAARTRRLAREELENAPKRNKPVVALGGVMDLDSRCDADADIDQVGVDMIFAMSPRYIDPTELEALQQRPLVSFTVQNAAVTSSSSVSKKQISNQKEDAVASASSATPAPVDRRTAGTLRARQSWHPPVHVPLSHRKLVTAPSIFGGVAPFPPVMPHPPSSSSLNESKRKHKVAHESPRGVPNKLARLSPKSNNQTQQASSSEQLSNRAHMQSLREKNPEIYDRLVRKFQSLERIETSNCDAPWDSARVSEKKSQSAATPPPSSSIETVEDAILFFLNEKHKHDILYFKRKSKASGIQPSVDGSGRLSLKFSGLVSSSDSKFVDPSIRYMPYNLERIDSMLKPEAGDYYIMSASSLVHHANNSGDDIVGEAIPISQWILESRMFSLLLAGIPLFQKFLVRKVFVCWSLEVRRRIYRDLRKRISRSLPVGRSSFVQPMLQSYAALRKVQVIRALSLPPKRSSAVNLSAVQDHHKVLLTMTETRLIDAKEELLSVMDAMVSNIQVNLDPSTNVDELYTTEGNSIHMSNSKWKSAPISSLRRRKGTLHHQKETAKLDMSLLERYIRMMEYMFTGSVYLMIIGCVKRLAADLNTEEYSGVICASVAIYGETLLLSPSHYEMKQVVLEGVARLIRLATNFHFTKNAMAWSKNRGTGSLAVVAAFFESRTNAKSQFDLQDVLRKDFHFDAATRELLAELAKWFEEAGCQMVAFESLKTIYASVHSIRSGTEEGRRHSLQQQSLGNSKSGSVSAVDASSQTQQLVNIAKIIGISGNELTRYLKSITYRFNLLDRSQHACQKIQSSWKVGFLEIQCRRSISEIFDLITQERDLLHRTLYNLVVAGVTECVSNLQEATLVFEDRPQLIEFFCDQMKQVRALKDGEKQLHQDIRNVDEAVRVLKRYTPTLASDCALQYNLLHNLFGKYTTIVQSHAKFAAKMLPLITQQVNSALQKYSARIQRLLRMYEEYSGISTEDELERNLALFHDIVRELHSIEDASRLYQEYQRMVGLKLVEIPMLLETTKKWEEVQQIVSLAVQWHTTLNMMENGIFSEQRWRRHAEKLEAFLPRIQDLQQRKELQFAARLVEHLRTSIVDYLHKLDLIGELSYSYVKSHHWQQILGLLGAVNFVSSTGILVTDGSTLTLGFLRSRNVWDCETQIREIIRRAQHDSVTEKKLDDMKRRLFQAILPLLRTGDFYEIDIPHAVQLLASFEDDLLTIQALGQITTSSQLNASLVVWAEEITHYQEVLDLWISAQHSWTKLSLMFCLPDVQQSVSGATFEFQSLDRKWKSMMNAARGASSLTICLREVISLAFLNNAIVTFEKLWKQLHSYLSDKRRFFSRLNFLSDDDLLQLIASARYPTTLSHLISKCYHGIHSLQISALGGGVVKRVKSNLETESSMSEFVMQGSMFAVTESAEDESDESTHTNTTATMNADFLAAALHHASFAPALCQIDGVNGAITMGEALPIKPLHISSSPEIWMKDLLQRVRQSMKDSVSSTMSGGALVDAFEGNFDELVKHSEQHLRKRRDSIRRSTVIVGGSSLQSHDSQSTLSDRAGTLGKDTPPTRRLWENVPIQVLVLCLNILLTNELTALVNCDRNDSGWKNFWLSFYKKKVNLVDFMKRRDSTVQDRMVATTLLTWMINKSTGIHDLYEEHPVIASSNMSGLGVVENAASVQYHHQHEENSNLLYRYNYSASDSFAWIKMMRFYYEPFENKCVVHHAVKTFEYGFAYLGGYSCPVLTPLCDRVLMKMSAALSLERGCLLHTSSSGQSGKRTMAKELAATVGVECIDYNCALVVGFDQFQRMIRGLLQSEACWLCITGLETSVCSQQEENSASSSFHLVRAFAHEMNRLKDAIHARQEAFPLDGEMVDIVNPRCAFMVTAHLHFAKPEHQELMLQLSNAFVPVGCVHPEYELIWETMLYASGMKHWKALSKKLTNLFLVVENHPEPFADTFLSSLHIVFAVAGHVIRQRAVNYLGHEEKCVLVALWDEVRSRILPARRIAFLKVVRSMFPLANTMDFTPLGILTTRVDITERKLSVQFVQSSESITTGSRPSTAEEEAAEKLRPGAPPPVVYDSDDEEKRTELTVVKELIVASMAAKHLIPSESILRKFMELYHVVNRSVVTVVVGSGMCGKSSAIDVLSCVFGSRGAQQTSMQMAGVAQDDDLTMSNLIIRRMKTVRLYPAAFHMSDIYGQFKENDGKAWEDGFLVHFLRQNCRTSQAFQISLSNGEDEIHSPENSNASHHPQLGSRRLSHRGSVALTRLGSHEFENASQMVTPTVRHASTPWMVLDGIRDASLLIEPLKDIARVSLYTGGGGDNIKKLILPNGDQLHCDNPDMRVFCELENLQHWSPACLCHFGLVYLESDHVLPYTLLIKSWSLRETSQIQTKPPESSISSNTTNCTVANTIDFAAKFMRSLVSPLLEVCKRSTKQFMDFSASHLVDKMLQVVSLLLRDASAFEDNSHTVQAKEIKLIVAYASTLSFGLFLQAKARSEFNALIMKNVPVLAEMLRSLSANAPITVFDVGLRFERHRATFFLWDPSSSLSNDHFNWSARVSRRSSSAKGTGPSEPTNATSSPSFGSGSSNNSAASSSHIYIPTPRTMSTEAWLVMFGAAKMNAFVFGDSAVGKTRILQNCSQALSQRESFVTSTLHASSALSVQNIQCAIETGLSRKLKALFCPGAGKRAFLITLENLNLETESKSTTRSCSEMIRQVCDAKGSFVKASKEFAEFKDVVVWASFSLSAFGYPRLSSRLLRHFNLIWLPDQSDALCKTILATFPDQFVSQYANESQLTALDISRISRLPIEIFKAARKRFKPSSTSPMLLFSITDVIKHFSLMMNCSSNAVGDLLELELLSIHFAQHIYCSRSGVSEIDAMTQICHQTAKRLRFDVQSLASIGTNYSGAEYLFADCGNSEGFSRIPYPAAVNFFRAGEERFHWYHKSVFKENSGGVDGLPTAMPQLPKLPTLSQASAAGSFSSISHVGHRRSITSSGSGVRGESTSSLTGVFSSATGSVAMSTSSSVGYKQADLPAEAQRRYSLIMAARKSTNQEKFTTPSPHLVANMLDIYTFLQDGAHDLLLYGSDTSTRRSAARIACGVHSFHFKEISAQVKTSDFVDQLKAVILDTGLKSMPTLMYLDCDFLSERELELAMEVVILHDIPVRLYTTADKAQILGFEHQYRHLNGLNTSSNPTNKLPSRGNEHPDSHPEGSSLHTRSAFQENLKRCFYVALSFGEPTRLFEIIHRYPSVYYAAGVKAFQPADDLSLEVIFVESLSSCESLSFEFIRLATLQKKDFQHMANDFQAMMVEIHQKTSQLLCQQGGENQHARCLQAPDAKRRAFAAVRSHFEEFLRIFKLLFVFQKSKLKEKTTQIEMIMQKLEEVTGQVNNQLAREVNSDTQLKDAAREVVESAEKLRGHELMEREAKRAFLLDEQRCALLQSEIEQEGEIIHLELAKTLPDLMAATESLAQINKYHITEMKSFTNPPQLVRLVMQAVCVLLGSPPTWAEALRTLADIRFIDRLRSFDRDHVDPSLIERVKLYINHPDFSMENMKRASLASTTLCKWVLAIVRYFEVMKHVAPTQKKLEATERNFQVIDELVQAERKKLVDLELYINELRAKHARNLQFEEELQHSHDSRVKWKSKVSDFAYVLSTWKDAVFKTHKQLSTLQGQLVEHCIIVAAFIIYGSAKSSNERLQLLRLWISTSSKYIQSGSGRAVDVDERYIEATVRRIWASILKHWTLSGQTMVQELKHAFFGIKYVDKPSLVTNLFLTDQIQKVCLRYPLLLDPLGQASAWLKEKFSISRGTFSASMVTLLDNVEPLNNLMERDEHGSGVATAGPTLLLLIDAGDPLLMSTIEKQMSQKSPPLILIESVSKCEEMVLNAIFELLALIKRKDENTIFFSTKSLSRPLAWTPKIWSQFTLINFTPTADDLETQFVSLFFQSFPVENDDCCTEKDWRLYQKQLTAEKDREKQLFEGFLDSVLATTDSKNRPSASSDSFPVSMWSDDDVGNNQQGDASSYLPEADMRRITTQLKEYTTVKKKRKQVQRTLERIRCKRSHANRFAKHLCALVTAEEKLKTIDSSAPCLSLVTIMEDMRDCMECGKSEAFYTDFVKLQAVSREKTVEGDANQETEVSDLALKLLAEQAAEFVTMRYIEKRLAGLPTSLHKKFVFLVSICIADNAERSDPATLNQLLTSALFCEMHAMNPVTRTKYYPALSLDGEESRDTIAKQMAQHTANLATAIALMTVCRVLESSPNIDDCGDANTTATLAVQLSQLDPGVHLAYLRIQKAFAGSTSTQNNARKRKFSIDLLEDMLQSMDQWKAYLRKTPTSLMPNTAAAAPVSSSASLRPLGGGVRSFSCRPPWVAERLTPLEKVLVHVCLFDSISATLLDDFIASQLGDDTQMKTLSHRLDSEANRSLTSIAKSVAFSKPILLLSNPCFQVSTGLSNVLQCAQKMGVREDSLSCVSMGSETSVANFRLGEFSHNNLIANTNAMNYSETVRNLSGIKESALSGGWVVIKDTEFGSLAAKNALRQQVESMKKLHANRNNDFRLWLQVEMSRLTDHHHRRRGGDQHLQYDRQSGDDFLAYLPAERRYVEFPQSLAQYYAVFLRQEDERAEQHQQLHQQHQQPSQQLQPRRPKMISRQSSFAKGHSQRASSSAAFAVGATGSSTEHSWIQAALWVFHAVFRSHLQRGSPSDISIQRHTQGSSNQLPADLLASHFELERSLRLIQLYMRERVLAATANDAAGSSSSRSTISQGSSAALLTSDASGYSASETRTMVELVSVLYMGRQWSDVRAKQCHELLEWCFTGRQHLHQHHGIGEHAPGSDASAQLRNQLMYLREQILRKKLTVASNVSTGSSGAALETRYLPLQLQCERDVCESIDLLWVLKQSASCSEADTVGGGMLGQEEREQRHKGGSCLVTAQRSLKRVLDRFPRKTSLSSSVELQRIKRHTSIFVAYQKGTRGMEPQQIAAYIANSAASSAKAARGSEVWCQALLTHLMEVELPAMEAYLKYVWSMSDTILSLNSDSHDVATAASSSTNGFYREILSILEALSAGFVPASWKSFRQKAVTTTTVGANERDNHIAEGGSGYAMPIRMEEWVNWLSRAVAFYHQVQTRPKHLVDVVWVPGLQHPKAFLFSLCYSVAEAHDASISEISLSISSLSTSVSSEKAGQTDGSEEGNHANSVRAYQSSRLASIAISGLYLANAEWSSELGVLVESTSATLANGRYQLLPVLEMHVTTHFKPQDNSNAASILGLGGVSRSGNAENEQESSRNIVNPASTPATGNSISTNSVDLSRQVRKSDKFFYRCPLFKTRLHFATLQEPVAYVYVPTDQAAGLMTVHSAALFLSND